MKIIIPLATAVILASNLITPPQIVEEVEIMKEESDPISFFSGEAYIITDDTASTTAPTHKPEEAGRTYPFLAHYPFELSNPPVEIAEGFAAYDGFLGDSRGDYHKGIDYVRRSGTDFLPFNTYAMHTGEAWRGNSETWGEFVIIRRTLTPTLRYYTVYGHLVNVPSDIVELPEEQGFEIDGTPISAGDFVGLAYITGNAKGVAQLHIELHEENLVAGTWVKLDPYGVYSTRSSGDYSNPGTSLEGLDHYWLNDLPEFIY